MSIAHEKHSIKTILWFLYWNWTLGGWFNNLAALIIIGLTSVANTFSNCDANRAHAWPCPQPTSKTRFRSPLYYTYRQEKNIFMYRFFRRNKNTINNTFSFRKPTILSASAWGGLGLNCAYNEACWLPSKNLWLIFFLRNKRLRNCYFLLTNKHWTFQSNNDV